jgi:arylsulfatase A-like enzyme
MRKIPILATVIFIIVLSLFFSCRSKSHIKSKPKNLLFIVVDTLRADHLGCYGYKRNTSPNIDEFAEKSAVFYRAFSHSPWTTPSIASMFTSLTPRDHGIAKWEDPLTESLVTLAEHLKGCGYRTEAAISHSVLVPKYGFAQGFDNFDTSILKKGDPHKISSSEHITNFGIKALDRHKAGERFFIWLHYFDPHLNYYNHKGFKFGKKRIDKYDSEIAYTDYHINRLLKYVKKTGLNQQTIIVLIADHGEEFNEHGGYLHGWKIYNEAVRVPLIIYVPGFIPQQISNIVAETDVAPTLLSLLELPIPEQFKGKVIPFDGYTFRPDSDRTVYLETYFMSEVCKRGILEGDWKLIHDCYNDIWKMFNLEQDPGEQNNLYATSDKIFEKLKKRFEEVCPSEQIPIPKQKKMSEDMKARLKSLGYIR